MTRPPHTWGKGSKALTRYEQGRLAEQDEATQSDDPSAFTGKDVVRATPLTQSTRKKRKLPRPGKHEPEIPESQIRLILYGDRESEGWDLTSYATHYANRKQAYLACQRRGRHEWRSYFSTWRTKTTRHHICIECGELH